MHAAITPEDVRCLAGDLPDSVVAAILATGADGSDLAEAAALLRGDDVARAPHRAAIVEQVLELLAAAMDEDDDAGA